MFLRGQLFTLFYTIMKTKAFLIILLPMLLIQCTTVNNKMKKPPLAPIMPVETDYFGTEISDPYRYMENLKDTTVLKWMKEQADYSRSVLNSITGRQGLIDKMVEFDSRRSERVTSLNITDNDKYFYLKTRPEDETGKLYYRNGFEGEEKLLFDPDKFDTDTTKKYVISSLSPSYDGSLVAFELAANGSESSNLLIMDVKTEKLYPEKIDRCWGASPAWLSDGSGFFYNRMNSSDVHQIDRELNSKALFHVPGTDPATDRIALSSSNNPDLKIKPEEIPIVFYDNDSKWLFGILATVDNRLDVYYAPLADLKKPKIAWRHLFKPEDEVYNFATSDKDVYVYTPKGAPNFKILKTSLVKPDLVNAEAVVPEDPERTMTTFIVTHDGIYYALSENGVSVRFYSQPFGSATGKEISLPFPAGDISISGKGYKFSDVWISITGWTSASQRYRYQPEKGQFKPENLSTLAQYPEYGDLTVEELMIPSYDGVKVPLSLIYNKSLKKDGNNPVFIYGYGSYGISISPFFSPSFLLWTANNGILAIAHVRGGGELGDSWYKGGYKTTKPNTWKDLIASAEYLVDQNYTNTSKIAINGGSAGGILIGRAMTERPDLFAVAIPEVGSLDPVRAEESPNGPANVPEFGTVKDSTECMSLIEMDAYLHIKDGVKYPATLITAGMNDPRVIVWEPAKFAARLEAADASDKPVLFYVDYEAGHGIGNTKTKDFESLADVLSFALWQTGNKSFRAR